MFKALNEIRFKWNSRQYIEINIVYFLFIECKFYVGARTARWLITRHEIPVDLAFYNTPKGTLNSLSKNNAMDKKHKPFVKGQLVIYLD